MRRTVFALLLAFVLMFSLSGCTRDKNNSATGTPGSNSTTNNGTTNNGTNNGGTNSGNSTTDNNTANSGKSRSGSNGMTNNADDLFRGRSYDEMLRNGRVTDGDGNLFNDADRYGK